LLNPKPNFHTVSEAIVQFGFDQSNISNFYDYIHETITDRIENEFNSIEDSRSSKIGYLEPLWNISSQFDIIFDSL
jgi:hypothetical protein